MTTVESFLAPSSANDAVAVSEKVTATASSRLKTALVHRNVDAWLIGGLSLLVYVVMYVAVPKNGDVSQVSWAAFYLAFIVNSPHFFASYWHLYVDGRRKIFRKPGYFWAAIVVPVLLIAALAVGARQADDKLLGRMVNLMFLSVGWHYVKQIFGVSLVASAAHGRPVTGWTKKTMRLSLLAVWLMSWVTSNDTKGGNTWYGIGYSSAGLPSWTRNAAYVVLGFTTAVALLFQLRMWLKNGVSMALVGWVAWASIIVWYLPVLSHPVFFYLVPFFHSLQYLLFSVTLSWNKARRGGVADEAARVRVVQRFGAFVAVSCILGAAGFHWIPEWLDRHASVRPDVIGGFYWVVAFNLFINVHHYFVDNVIWRGTNEDVRTYLRPKPSSIPTTVDATALSLA